MVKLLSIAGLHHDLNISYYESGKVNYMKLERETQRKHFHAWYEEDFNTSCHQVDNITNYIQALVDKYYPQLGINTRHLDAICIDTNLSYVNRLDSIKRDHNLSYLIKPGLWMVDHHYLHALSTDAGESEHNDIHFVLDGRGGVYTSSVFRNDRRIDSVLYERGSLGQGMASLGIQLGVTGNSLDATGKFMGLQSYGQLDQQLLDCLSNNYNLSNLGSRWDYQVSKWYRGIFDLDQYTDKLSAAHTMHYWAGMLIKSWFKQWATPREKVSYSGGVAQNILWNTELKKEFPNLLIKPHCADDGLSLGGLEFLRRRFNLPTLNLPEFPFMQCDVSPDTVITNENIKRVAEYLSQGKIVAWYQGHGEVGPRALGHRSILMDPRIGDGRDRINQIKKREYYRPFGASVLSEYAVEYFDLTWPNPYMLYVGRSKFSNLSSITHVDGTCRVQTVAENSGSFRQLLEYFHQLTGCPVLLNTSLNIAGQPIAGTPKQALDEFYRSAIDVLVVGDLIYKK